MKTNRMEFDMAGILEELNEQSVYYVNNPIVNSEKILKCLQIAIIQEKKICVENFSLYRLESLSRAITIKKNMLERLNYKPYKNSNERICEIETKLKAYTNQAISLIKEIVTTGRLQKNNNNVDYEVE